MIPEFVQEDIEEEEEEEGFLPKKIHSLNENDRRCDINEYDHDYSRRGNGLSISDTLVPPFRDGPHMTDPIKIAQETRASTALLLAAGTGTRLQPLTLDAPSASLRWEVFQSSNGWSTICAYRGLGGWSW